MVERECNTAPFLLLSEFLLPWIHGDKNGLPGGYSEREPPDPIPNSEVKTLSADDSVGSPHVKVGHCQVLYAKPPVNEPGAFYFFRRIFLTQHLAAVPLLGSSSLASH